jgi:hypothetical protein
MSLEDAINKLAKAVTAMQGPQQAPVTDHTQYRPRNNTVMIGGKVCKCLDMYRDSQTVICVKADCGDSICTLSYSLDKDGMIWSCTKKLM